MDPDPGFVIAGSMKNNNQKSSRHARLCAALILSLSGMAVSLANFSVTPYDGSRPRNLNRHSHLLAVCSCREQNEAITVGSGGMHTMNTQQRQGDSLGQIKSRLDSHV